MLSKRHLVYPWLLLEGILSFRFFIFLLSQLIQENFQSDSYSCQRLQSWHSLLLTFIYHVLWLWFVKLVFTIPFHVSRITFTFFSWYQISKISWPRVHPPLASTCIFFRIIPFHFHSWAWTYISSLNESASFSFAALLTNPEPSRFSLHQNLSVSENLYTDDLLASSNNGLFCSNIALLYL